MRRLGSYCLRGCAASLRPDIRLSLGLVSVRIADFPECIVDIGKLPADVRQFVPNQDHKHNSRTDAYCNQVNHNVANYSTRGDLKIMR